MARSDPKKAYVYVHIPRTGGTSVSRCLQGSGKVVGKHATAAQVREVLGVGTWDSHFTFATIRNPYDWAVSTHFYIQQRREHPAYHRLRRKSLYETLIWWQGSLTDRPVLTSYVCDEHEVLLVDSLIRFETIARDWERIANHLGLHATLPRINRTERKLGYREYYDDRSRELAGQLFERDCRLFGYRF